jgi:hypothetical protein
MARLIALLSICLGLACAGKPVVSDGAGKRILLVHDDGKTDGTIAFPSPDYEAVLRFELPPGEHRLAHLWFHAAAAGTIHWALYEQTALETPGAVIAEGTREVAATDVCDGRAGVWLTQDLSQLAARQGVVWVGLKKAAGEPTIWASSTPTRAYFVRNVNPRTPMDLLPVKRSPHLRLEVAP